MKRKKTNNHQVRFFIIGKFLMIVILLCFGVMARSQETALIVISNQNGSPAELRLSELKSIFMGEKQRWKTGTKITIALMKTNTPVGNITSKKIYDMSADELNKFWLALVFQGKAQAPLFFNSAAELENYVAKNPGTIGIIDHVISTDEIKTILIEGKKFL